MLEPKKVQNSIDLKKVKVQDDFWSHIQQLMLDVVIPYQEDVLHDRIPGVEKSHAVENFRIAKAHLPKAPPPPPAKEKKEKKGGSLFGRK